MSLHARLAVAAGAAGVGAATLLLAQRSEGTVPAVLLLVLVARAAGPAAALHSGGDAASTAAATLSRQTAFVPVWILAAAAASVRAGSTVIGDVAGAHAVAGLAIARGPVAGVAGIWLCAVAVSIAIAGSTAEWRSEAVSSVPARMDLLGGLAQIAFAVALFAGPQIRQATDAAAWIGAAAVVAVWSWFGRGPARLPAAPYAAIALGLAGLVLVVAGGRG